MNAPRTTSSSASAMPPTETAGVENNWSEASSQLAARIHRRARWSKILTRVGYALMVGGLAALALRLYGAPTVWLVAAWAVALAVGLRFGLRAQVAPTNRGAAAWALDRLGSHQERGLTAAMCPSQAATEAISTRPKLADPMHVRLRPPDGLVPFAGALLLAGAVVLAPLPTDSTTKSDPLGSTPSTRTAGDASASADASKSIDPLSKRAQSLDKVRSLASVPSHKPLDRETLTRLLRDPVARKSATDALTLQSPPPKDGASHPTSGTNTEGSQDPSEYSSLPSKRIANDPEQLAQWLTNEDQRIRHALRTERRDEARATLVPASRRELIARYIHERRASELPTAETHTSSPAPSRHGD